MDATGGRSLDEQLRIDEIGGECRVLVLVLGGIVLSVVVVVLGWGEGGLEFVMAGMVAAFVGVVAMLW